MVLKSPAEYPESAEFLRNILGSLWQKFRRELASVVFEMARTAEQNEAERSRGLAGRKNSRTREEDDRGCTWTPTRPQRAGKKARRRGHGWLVAHNATASSTIRVATPIMAVAKGE